MSLRFAQLVADKIRNVLHHCTVEFVKRNPCIYFYRKVETNILKSSLVGGSITNHTVIRSFAGSIRTYHSPSSRTARNIPLLHLERTYTLPNQRLVLVLTAENGKC